MEEHDFRRNSHFFPVTFNGRISENAYEFLGGINDEQQDVTVLESSGTYEMPVLTTQWEHFQENPHNYLQFLSEKGYSEPKEQMHYSMQPQNQGFISEHSQLEPYVSLHFEGNSASQFANSEDQVGVQKQVWSSDSSYAPQAYLRSGPAKTHHTSDSRRKRSREKAYASDRSRRMRLSHALRALQEVVPHSQMVDREAFLDHVIDYVKKLQCQMKDLSQRRLGGEPTSSSVLFLEGLGHYIVHEQMLEGPVEETLGRLISVDPSAAYELLQSRGLIVMPTVFSEGLHENPLKGFTYKEEGAFPSTTK